MSLENLDPQTLSDELNRMNKLISVSVESKIQN